jgi:hypothetical protein
MQQHGHKQLAKKCSYQDHYVEKSPPECSNRGLSINNLYERMLHEIFPRSSKEPNVNYDSATGELF